MMNNKIRLMSELVIKYFTEKNFKLFIKALLTLKEIVISMDPSTLDVGMVDLIMDENMFDWVVEAASRVPSENDWNAATYIAADLQDILKNSISEE